MPDVHDREFLLTLHRRADKYQFDMTRYNELRERIQQTEYDLQRLRDPLQLHLPQEHLDTLRQRRHTFTV